MKDIETKFRVMMLRILNKCWGNNKTSQVIILDIKGETKIEAKEVATTKEPNKIKA